MKHVDELRATFDKVTRLALKHDGYPEDTEDAEFSRDNPWLELRKRVMRNIVEAMEADRKHGALVIKTLSNK